MHFGGVLEIVNSEGEAWRGTGADETRSSLAPVLDRVGNRVTEAHVDEAERLHLAFDDRAQLIAESGSWEGHWPMPGGFDDRWVPREGPNIP